MKIRNIFKRFSRSGEVIAEEVVEEEVNHDAGERWDESDDDTLIRLVGAGCTNQEIGDSLGRTKKAIASRKYILRKRGLL